jgi:hypothetical protein
MKTFIIATKNRLQSLHIIYGYQVHCTGLLRWPGREDTTREEHETKRVRQPRQELDPSNYISNFMMSEARQSRDNPPSYVAVPEYLSGAARTASFSSR